MSCEDLPVLGSDTSGSQYIFIVLNGQDLATDQSGHSYPVQKSEYNEHGDHITTQLRKWCSLDNRNQPLIKYHGKQDNDQHIRKGIDHIHNSHHYHTQDR